MHVRGHVVDRGYLVDQDGALAAVPLRDGVDGGVVDAVVARIRVLELDDGVREAEPARRRQHARVEDDGRDVRGHLVAGVPAIVRPVLKAGVKYVVYVAALRRYVVLPASALVVTSSKKMPAMLHDGRALAWPHGHTKHTRG